METKYSEEYPLKTYDHLANPEFRKLLCLEFKDCEGDYACFKEEIEKLGQKAHTYSKIFFEVAKVEYAQQKEAY